MATRQQQQQPPPVIDPAMVEPMVDSDVIARMLGVTADTVRDWHHSRGLPAVRISKRRYKFLPSKVLAWRDARETVVVVKREDVQAEAPATVPQRRRRMSKAEAEAADEEFPY